MSAEPASTSSRAFDSETVSRIQWYGWLTFIFSGPLALLILKLFPNADAAMLHNPPAHVLIVGIAATLGVSLALLVLQVGYRLQDGRVFLIGIGFLCISILFVVHAIATPDVLMEGRSVASAWSALLSLVIGGFFFALSGISTLTSLNRWIMRHASLWVLVCVLIWGAYAWIFLVEIPALTSHPATAATPAPLLGMSHDSLLIGSLVPPAEPLSGSLLDEVRRIFVVLGLGCYGIAIAASLRLYRRLPTTTGLAIASGMALFGEALLTQQLSSLYSASFWLYHIEEFAGFGIISYALLVAYRRGLTNEGLLESLLLPDTRTRLRAQYTTAMEAVVQSLARGEQPTNDVRQILRISMGLNENQVQVLEHAALSVAQERQQRQELERLNESLRQLEQDRDDLMQMLVHDLKNPLTALVGFLEILRKSDLDERQRSLLVNALQSGRNLAGLIGDLLDIGRIEDGHPELTYSLFALHDMATECATEMSAWLVQEKKIIQNDIAPDLPLLYADERLIRRVLLNLISNAIKHTGIGTRITLSASVAWPDPDTTSALSSPIALTPTYIIEVKDTGPGIPAEHQAHIFKKFRRATGTQNRRQQSSGLGLAFCRLAIEAHGGNIGIQSIVGQGATFWISLPWQTTYPAATHD